MVKNLPSSAGDAGDVGSISGWGRSPGGGTAEEGRKFAIVDNYWKSLMSQAVSFHSLAHHTIRNV